MKINRAVGLLLFLFAVQFILSSSFSAFDGAASATLESIEAAAGAVTQNFAG